MCAAVTLYVRNGCPFCSIAETVLKSSGIIYTAVDVNQDPKRLEELSSLAGEPSEALTVPKVWFEKSGMLVRSSEELKGLHLTTALKHLARGSLELPQPRQALPWDGQPSVCLLHTGPTNVIWLAGLNQRLSARGANVVFVDAENVGAIDLGRPLPFSAVVNRVSDAVPPTLARYVTSFLRIASAQGIPVVNGSDAWSTVNSKAVQYALFRQAGVQSSNARLVRCVSDVEAVAPMLFAEAGSVLFKPNAGSFGQGIARFDDPASLYEHARQPAAFGNDGLALVEAYHHVERVQRVFLLDGRVQCGVSTAVDPQRAFSGMCMGSASRRQQSDGSAAVSAIELPEKIVEACERVMRLAHLDVGSIEYLLPPHPPSDPVFFDLNCLSTYPGPELVGKDCWDELAAFIFAKASAPSPTDC
eukprot:TRINITY_DN62504_c0_g1_i1.p1 TRINITY_DN62504_c0_g1~~TRINITY_DN62504_c0_g1_i1.p1  ORF type:complete len:416 (+),score=56.33 TRINITY_DN62504_c0_g1_i1:53-1300(+)